MRSSAAFSSVTTTSRLRLTSSMRTRPAISLMIPVRLGFLASKQLFNTGKTLGDVLGAGNTAGVEGTHGQLGTGLADRLGGDDTDGLADGNRLAVGKVGAVALFADAVLGAGS